MTHIGHFRAAAKPTQTESSQSTQSASPKRPAHDLWAVLMACIYEVFPTLCPLCGGQMRIIAFITHSADIGHILEHIGAQTKPPRITPAHDLWAVLMRRWAMVSTLRQIGMKRPKWPRTLMSISASVGEQWRQRFCQRCGAGLRLAPPKTGQPDKSQATGLP